jgi:hypothetical protein
MQELFKAEADNKLKVELQQKEAKEKADRFKNYSENFESNVRNYQMFKVEDKTYKSEMYEWLSPEIWDEYEEKKCEFGLTFSKCVEKCISTDELGSYKHLRACSASHYKLFSKVFDRAIKESIKTKPKDDMKAEEIENLKFIPSEDWTFDMEQFTDSEIELVKHIKIVARRNYDGFPFTKFGTKEHRN